MTSKTNSNDIKSFKKSLTPTTYYKKFLDKTEVGAYLYENWIKPYNLSANALARAVGVAPNRIIDIINGKRGISIDTDLRLCKYFNLKDGHFIFVQHQIEQDEVKRKISKKLDKIVITTGK
ncbi:MAG: HigA family addiction module antidote protein [Rickettsiales bacterium]|nr:HigA family addiction module antidote protein [Rickettsiales bacterium]